MPVGVWQKRFITTLFSTVLLIRGRMNFSSLARHSFLNEKSYRRGFRREFDFMRFNLNCIEQREGRGELAAVMDASFLAKSGKKTFGLGRFYNGCSGKVEKGLEISELALVDKASEQAFSLSCQQTIDQEGKTRPELYAEQVERCYPDLPKSVKHLLVDGYYSKKHFIDPVCALGLEVVGKLRRDADLRYLYRGAYQGRGRPRRFDGKVSFDKLSRWVYEGEAEPDLHLFAQTLWHVSFKRIIRVALLLDTSQETSRHTLLFSTDLSLSGSEIRRLYKLRFQVEFLFRDAKGLTGLAECQARDQKALAFHFNIALSAVNLAKLHLLKHHQPHKPFVFSLNRYIQTAFNFSLNRYIQTAFNRQLLSAFLANSALDLTCPKIKQAFHSTLSFGLAEP